MAFKPPCVYILALSVGSLQAMVSGFTVVGRIEDSQASPVAGARVTLFAESLETFQEAWTGDEGNYRIAEMSAGIFRFGVAAPGYDYEEFELSIGPSDAIRDVSLQPESHPGRWAIVGSTLPDFLDATNIALLTPEGKVYYCHSTDDPVVFDPVTGESHFPQGSGTEQGCMNGTLLADGRLIMVGGQSPTNPGSFRNAIRWVKTYSFVDDTWQRLSDLVHPVGRWYPGLARLADGRLLAMGGGTRPNATRTATCELFDPVLQHWRYTGSMVNPCEFPPSALLHTGEVLATWSPPQLFDAVTETWRRTGAFNQPHRGWPDHSDHSLVVLADGRALAIGIRAPSSSGSGRTRGGRAGEAVMGEIYDPNQGTWDLTSNSGLVRLQPEVVQLPDGKILVAAGETQVSIPPVETLLGVVKWCDLYDPVLDAWRRVADMHQYREYHAVTLLVPDGRVLTTGGTRIKFQVGPSSADIEAYEPPYLFRGVRPEIVGVSATDLARADELSLEIFPETRITSIVLIGTPATTHWVDAGIPRRLVLPVTQSGGFVAATLPSDPNVLPLGFYMVFAMVDDIPSVAWIVKIVA